MSNPEGKQTLEAEELTHQSHEQVEHVPESRLDDLAVSLQEAVTALEGDAAGSAKIIEKLGLQEAPEAQVLQGQHLSRLQILTERAKRIAASAAFAGGLLFGGGSALAQSESTEQLQAPEAVVDATGVQSGIAQQGPKLETTIDTPEELPASEEALSDTQVIVGEKSAERPQEKVTNEVAAVRESADNKETREMTEDVQRIMVACFYSEEGKCLGEVVSTVAGKAVRDMIPFKGGLSSIYESTQDKSLTDDERVLGVLKGAAMVLRDAALFASGAGIVRFAQIYRIASLANDANDASKFYAGHKEMIDDYLGTLFKGREIDAKRVQEKIATSSGGPVTN